MSKHDPVQNSAVDVCSNRRERIVASQGSCSALNEQTLKGSPWRPAVANQSQEEVTRYVESLERTRKTTPNIVSRYGARGSP
jgi:hypothetical protein